MQRTGADQVSWSGGGKSQVGMFDGSLPLPPLLEVTHGLKHLARVLGASALGLQACGAARVPPLSAARQKADPALFSPRPCSGCSFACGSVAPSSATHRQRWSPEASPTPGDVTRVHSDFLVS